MSEEAPSIAEAPVTPTSTPPVDPKPTEIRRTVAEPQKPSLGRICHFVGNDGLDKAAIMSEVNGDDVSLTVFPNGYLVPFVPFSETGEIGTWHWPERV